MEVKHRYTPIRWKCSTCIWAIISWMLASRCLAWQNLPPRISQSTRNHPRLKSITAHDSYWRQKTKTTTATKTLLFLSQSTREDGSAMDTPIARMDALQSAQRNNNNHHKNYNAMDTVGSHLVDAAAAVTKDSCPLLGVKAVGVDYGLVRTGLAATVGYNPKALTILEDLNSTQACREVVQHCRAEQASQVIVGLPLHKNGTEAEQTQLTRVFANELATMVLQTLGPHVPVYLWDERYTSKEAAARAHSRDPNRYLYGTLDAEAACIILEHFYNANGKNAQRVVLAKDVEDECLRLWEVTRAEHDQTIKAAVEQRLETSGTTKRQEAMERARRLEAELQRDGTLGESRKQKKKKKKKKREKRGPWLVPGDDDATKL